MCVGEHIGSRIYELRSYYGIGQKELAEGICTQGNISHIEKGNQLPNSDILFQIAKKLGVGVQYFFEDYETPRNNYIEDTCEMIRHYLHKHEYERAYSIINTELKNPLFRRADLTKFLLWQKSVCHFHLFSKEEAIDLLDVAIDIKIGHSRALSMLDIELFTSSAIMLTDIGQYKQATLKYNTAIKKFKKHPHSNYGNIKIPIRILYNSSINFYRDNDFINSYERANQGIKLCLENDSLYLLGELYYQAGISSFKTGGKDYLSLIESSLWLLKKKASSHVEYINEKYNYYKSLDPQVNSIEV